MLCKGSETTNWFNQQNIAFEMEDDPFEVKLRDNYAVCYVFIQSCFILRL